MVYINEVVDTPALKKHILENSFLFLRAKKLCDIPRFCNRSPRCERIKEPLNKPWTGGLVWAGFKLVTKLV